MSVLPEKFKKAFETGGVSAPEVQEAPPSTERNISIVQDAIKKNVRSYETTVVNSDKILDKNN